ncbi:hypothetical protein [Lentzea cavernae]|uniref:Uncharacterized protein n=1 Tax=Lentzea cavernae TaxID=2020703 RepID=A0ABQ3MFS6_9PSEU|nr:hypothetical protein [Lentzea cavernae]GHH42115.1 hypothetical protein GCM10017774_37840 [Lentzea cavernae]
MMALLGLLIAHTQFREAPTFLVMLAMAFSAGPVVLAGLLGVTRPRSRTATSPQDPSDHHADQR